MMKVASTVMHPPVCIIVNPWQFTLMDELPGFLWVLACTEMMRPVPQGQCPNDEPGALIHNIE
jgi:hypothetical protein